jgi:site-specific DNA-methyltransferase (adenine-specific)
MSDRGETFETLRAALGDAVVRADGEWLLVGGDSLANLRALPDASVSLVLTDPPYHSTKKGNIHGDTQFEEDEHFLEWLDQYAAEWRRVLKMSGTLYVFCASEMSARLEVMVARHMRPVSHIAWSKPNEPGFDGWKGKMRKEALRAWYPHSERILMFEQGTYGSREAYRRAPSGEYLLACRKQAGLTMTQLTEATGEYGRVNRGGAVANWEAGRNIPSREQYAKLVATLEATGRVEGMLPYEDVIRPMHVDKTVAFTDIWDFASVRPFVGKHPAEKPQDMLMHMIAASTYPGDIVLDCFAGSGSTGVAARRLGCRALCMEIDSGWLGRAAEELANARPDAEYTPLVRKRGTQNAAAGQLEQLF